MSAIESQRLAPDEGFIESIRATYPVEAEIDRVLTRKMRRRSGPGYSPLDLTSIGKALTRLIRARTDAAFRIDNLRWLGGGASKLQVAFELQSEVEDRPQAMVLRMEPPEAIVETSRIREFEALNAVKGHVPVPTCRWYDAEAEFLPFPGLIYDFADGVTKPSAKPSQQVTGIGTNFGPEMRARLAPQFVNQLARIHTLPVSARSGLSSFEPCEIGSNASVIRQINWWRRVWEEDRPEDLPLVDVAARWLIDNAPPLDHVALVHGDYRAGNFLYDENQAKITAWLDWELSALGDRHQDLTWITGVHFGHYSEDGSTFLASGLLPAEELYERYEQASGLSVDPARLRYYRIFNDFTSCVHMLATAPRVAGGGKTHQDVVVAWLSMIGNVISGKLAASLSEVV